MKLPLRLLLILMSLAGDASAQRSDGAAAQSGDELFTRRTIPRLQIEIPPEGMEVLRAYHWRRDEGLPREDVRATVREGATVYTNVALHLKGSAGSFRPIDSDKPALTLNFDKFADGQRFHGLQKIHLNNSVQDASYISEPICRELFLKAGVPTPRASHAVIELNGAPPRLYVLVEGWNKQFLKRHFKNAKGNLYDGGAAKDITFPIEVTSGDRPEDRSRLTELLAAVRETNAAARLEQIERVLDVDRFLTFAAMEVILAHWDGYAMNRNNYRVFHDLDSDRLLFLPHGLDQMFGIWRSTPTSTITPMMKGVVARAVIQSPEMRRRYLDRIGFLITNVFDVAALTNRVQELTAKVQPALVGDFPALINQDRAAHGLSERMATRLRSVREQLRDANMPLAFDAKGVARLTGWKSSYDAGNPTFARDQGPPETLQISAAGNLAYGTWRTLVLLPEGDYQFTGRIRTQDLQFEDDVTRGGATLRLSGDRTARMISDASDWTSFLYDFSLSGLSDVELLCELRASQGRAWFDADSLKLVRQPAAKKE
jgi:hypothetical protein